MVWITCKSSKFVARLYFDHVKAKLIKKVCLENQLPLKLCQSDVSALFESSICHIHVDPKLTQESLEFWYFWYFDLKCKGQDKDGSKVFCYHDIVTSFDSYFAKYQYLKIFFSEIFGLLTLLLALFTNFWTGPICKCPLKK